MKHIIEFVKLAWLELWILVSLGVLLPGMYLDSYLLTGIALGIVLVGLVGMLGRSLAKKWRTVRQK